MNEGTHDGNRIDEPPSSLRRIRPDPLHLPAPTPWTSDRSATSPKSPTKRASRSPRRSSSSRSRRFGRSGRALSVPLRSGFILRAGSTEPFHDPHGSLLNFDKPQIEAVSRDFCGQKASGFPEETSGEGATRPPSWSLRTHGVQRPDRKLLVDRPQVLGRDGVRVPDHRIRFRCPQGLETDTINLIIYT